MKFAGKPSIKKSVEEHPDATVNYEGALAYTLDPLTNLYIRAASTLVGEPKFYETAEEADNELLKAVNAVLPTDPEFVLQLAVYCREKLYLRSVPLLLLAEAANKAPGIPNGRKYVARTIHRADELTELVAYQLKRNKFVPRKTKLPMMLKEGIAEAFDKFDAYQLAKYNRDTIPSLRDVMFMTHPKAKSPEQQEVFDKLTAKTLESPITWEVMRSTGKMTWHDVVNEIFNKGGKVMNYMAQLRNLRNCLQDKTVTSADVELLCRMLSDSNAVRYSKQLPFRFLSAFREVKKIPHPQIASVLDALEIAAGYSIENIPKLDGTTLIASDVSGSMETPISKNSSVQRWDIGIVLGMIAHKACDQAITGIFGDTWKPVPLAKYSAGLLHNSMELRRISHEVGWSTNGYKVIEYLLQNNIAVDRIMIFTDCQMWDSEATEVKVTSLPSSLGSAFRYSAGGWVFRPTYNDAKNFAEYFTRYQRMYPNVKLYTFDLSGYGTVMVPQNAKNTAVIGGWSDRVFEFVTAFEETGKANVIETIKAIKV